MVGKFASGEAITETADVSRGVSESKPDDFCVGIGEGTFCGFPDDIGDFRSFVEDQEQAFAFIVEAGEGRRVFLGPRNHVDAPSALAIGVFGEKACGG